MRRDWGAFPWPMLSGHPNGSARQPTLRRRARPMIAEPGARRRALLSDYGWILTIVILAVAAEVLRGPLDWIGSKIALAFGNVALGIISTPPLQHFDGF